MQAIGTSSILLPTMELMIALAWGLPGVNLNCGTHLGNRHPVRMPVEDYINMLRMRSLTERNNIALEYMLNKWMAMCLQSLHYLLLRPTAQPPFFNLIRA